MKLILADLNGWTPADTALALGCFPEARRGEIFALKTERGRAGSAAAEMLVRLEIAQTLRVFGETAIIERTENGKPYLAGHADFCFNLSHSGELAACAVDVLPVGVDVEKIRQTNCSAVAERLFSSGERRELAEAADPLAAFFRIWTAKESAVKQRGGRLFGDLRRPGTAAREGLCAPCITSFAVDSRARTVSRGGPCDYALSVCRSAQAPGEIAVTFRPAKEILTEFLAAQTNE